MVRHTAISSWIPAGIIYAVARASTKSLPQSRPPADRSLFGRENIQRSTSNTNAEISKAWHVLIRHWTFSIGRWTFLSSMSSNKGSALLIVAHGSTLNPDSSAPTLAHAPEIRRRKIFAGVVCLLEKETKSARCDFFCSNRNRLREVYVVPNFISEGYFAQTFVPRERS